MDVKLFVILIIVMLIAALALVLLSPVPGGGGCAEDGDCPPGFICQQETFCSQDEPENCFEMNRCRQAPESDGAVCGNLICEQEELQTCSEDCIEPANKIAGTPCVGNEQFVDVGFGGWRTCTTDPEQRGVMCKEAGDAASDYGLPSDSPSGWWCVVEEAPCAAPFCWGTFGDYSSEADSTTVYECNSPGGCIRTKPTPSLCENGVCEAGEETSCPQDCREPYPGPPELSCDEIDGEMERVMTCQQDSDCVFSEDITGCGFPCGMAHNKGYGAGEIQALISQWDNCHEWPCPAYGCPTDATANAVCENGACAEVTT